MKRLSISLLCLFFLRCFKVETCEAQAGLKSAMYLTEAVPQFLSLNLLCAEIMDVQHCIQLIFVFSLSSQAVDFSILQKVCSYAVKILKHTHVHMHTHACTHTYRNVILINLFKLSRFYQANGIGTIL